MVYTKTLQCTMCGKDMISRTANRLRCMNCKKIYLKKYNKNWLKNPEKLARHKAIEKIYRKNNSESMAKRQKEYSRKNPDRIKAHSLSYRIKIKTACELCGEENNLLHKHHWNYNKPLLISTLCVTCHAIQHLKNFKDSKYAGEIVVGI